MNHPAVNRLRFIYQNRGISGTIYAILRFVRSIAENIHLHLSAWMNYLRLRSNYGPAAPGPYHTIEIDPNQIDLILIEFSFSKERTYVRGGDWDRNISTDEIGLYGFEHNCTQPTVYYLDNYLLAEGMNKHFKEGIPWEDTTFYEHLMEHQEIIENRSGNYSSVKMRLESIEELFDKIKQEGYLSRKEIQLLSFPPLNQPPNSREIKVAIGRDGEIIFVDGRHRFIISRLLGIEEIPAKVILRHRMWMEVRTKFRNASEDNTVNTYGQFSNHPDLHDIINS